MKSYLYIYGKFFYPEEFNKPWYELSDYEEACKSIEAAIRITPLDEYESFKQIIEKKIIKNISDDSFNKALIYFDQCNYTLVEGILSEFNDDESLELRCECLYRLNKNKEALSIINQLLKRSENEKNLELKGKIYLAMGDKENSINTYEKLINFNEKYLSNLALAHGVFKDISLSKKYFSEIHSELSDIWVSYYDGRDDFLISGL